MDKSLWPTIAGILDIIHSDLSSNIGLMVLAGISIFQLLALVLVFPTSLSDLVRHFLIAIIPLVLINIVSIVGGVYEIKRNNWTLALTASITALLVNWFCRN